MKKVTRRQARAWLHPIRQCFNTMRITGESHAARGYAVTKVHGDDDWVRTDYCIAGFRALIERLFPKLDTSAMQRVQRRLANGVLVSNADLESCMRELRAAEDLLITVTIKDLHSAVLTEQINIEMEALQEKAA